MRSLSLSVMIVCVLAVSGCIVEPRGDFHRGWWQEHHRGENYEAERAEREHREYCARSCEGWYRR